MQNEPIKETSAPPQRKTPWRVVLIDEHPAMRFGLADLIGQEADLEVCAEAHDYESGLEAIRETQADAAVLGIDIPDGKWRELIGGMRKEFPGTKVMVVSQDDDTHDVLRALRAGAAGFLTKQDTWDKVRDGLRRVLTGGIFLGDDFAHRLIFRQLSDNGHLEGEGRLTNREREILDLLGDGLSARKIAEILKISPKTVETYRQNIKDKFDLGSGRALMQYARDRAVHNE